MNQREPYGNTTYLGSLILKIKAGGSGAEEARKKLTDESYRRFEHEVRRRLYDSLRDRGHETFEVLNETFFGRIFRKDELGKDLVDKTEFHDGRHFVAYVITHMVGCLRTFAEQMRKGQERKRQFQESRGSGKRRGRTGKCLEDEENLDNDVNDDVLADAETAQEGTVDRFDRWALMMEGVRDLDPKDREVFELTYFQETGGTMTPRERKLSRQEVADFLGVSTKTVQRHRQRAEEELLKRLHAKLAELRRSD